jgi:long-chain fatty acid transport protein
MYSLGAEYKYDPRLTLRTGVAYERSPVDDSNRLVILPDTNRIWASIGASYKWSDKLSFDMGYSHLFFEKNASIQAGDLLTATSNTSSDVVSLSMKYHLDSTAELLK